MSSAYPSSVEGRPAAGDRAVDPGFFYQDLGDGLWRPTRHVQGAWRETEQHMGPVSGLLAHALESAYPREDLQLCRISYDILGVITAEDSRVEVQVIRPGRTIELVQAELAIGGRAAVRATGWRLAGGDTSVVAGGVPEPLPEPGRWPRHDISSTWSGGYIDSVEFYLDPASRPGQCRAWLRTPVRLIDHGAVSDLAQFTALVDTANGVAARADPGRWMFPNTDLGVHYFRTPRLDDGSCWVGLDTTATWGANGIGLTSTTLFDTHGAVGRAEQILTLRPLS